MNTDKSGARHLTAILKEKKVKHIVLCPGSRNAPLIFSFTSDDYFSCYSIVDERSAGFFALGISQIVKSPVAVVCTSGSALLNLAPAVAEAYYQRLPLLVISADRPNEWVNQGESQTMLQQGVFQNYIRASFDLVQEPLNSVDLSYQDREIYEAIDSCVNPYFGPVHVNIRFREPLYGQSNEEIKKRKALDFIQMNNHLDQKDVQKLLSIWGSKSKIMILCGQMFPDYKLLNILKKLSHSGIVVLTESTSNLCDEQFIPCIDKIIIPADEIAVEKLMPEIVITIGGPVISRKIKDFLRKESNLLHWHIDPLDPITDAFLKQTAAVQMLPSDFLAYFESEPKKDLEYWKYWINIKNKIEENGNEFFSKASFSDFKAIGMILDRLKENAMIQVGNSASIRYVQLFDKARKNLSFSNRGTSGIEGSLSTAVGSSLLYEHNTFVILGDLSAMYDSNALWNNYVTPKLKIIIINNGGGGIFRIIDGPKSLEKFEEFIETKHNVDLSKLAELFNLKYFHVDSSEKLEEIWQDFESEKNKACLLEINTMNIENESVLMKFFDHLKINQ